MSWKRGQIVWALWQLAAGPKPAGDWTLSEISKTFTRRVVILVELGVGIDRDNQTSRSGTDQEYDLVDAVEIALALELMMFSWPQSEAAEYVVQNRRELRHRINSIDTRSNDRYMLWIRSRAYLNAFGSDEAEKSSLLYYPPIFTEDTLEEFELLHQLNGFSRGLLVINIANLKNVLAKSLPRAPEVRRGRQ